MQLEHVEEIRCCSNTRFYTACILVKIGLGSRFDLRNDREAVTRRGFRKDRPPFTLRKSRCVLRGRHCCWFDFHLLAPFISNSWDLSLGSFKSKRNYPDQKIYVLECIAINIATDLSILTGCEPVRISEKEFRKTGISALLGKEIRSRSLDRSLSIRRRAMWPSIGGQPVN